MNPTFVIILIVSYFSVLITIAFITSGKGENYSFFLGNRKSPWYVVSIGMIGTTISGVTFISVPGWVGDSYFSYMQLVLGYFVGYIIIANILLPLYYKLKLTSIYSYLDKRFGHYSYKTGASFFLISRLIGTAFRMFLVSNVLQITIFNALGVPFWATVLVTIALIWFYTFRGGIKTIIWTDLLQTFFLILALIFCTVLLCRELNLNIFGMVKTISASKYSQIFFWNDWMDKKHFVKQFLSGIFICIVMTGLDQDMMQKNLSCRSLKDAKKNMYWFSILLVFANLIFLSLGALLYIFASQKGIPIPERTDDLFPMIVMGHYLSSSLAGIFFTIGIIAATYATSDSALTAMTTSFTVDILKGHTKSEKTIKKLRMRTHVFLSIVLAIIIFLFKIINNQSVISALFTAAGYTYGPLLGMYFFGLFTHYKVKDRLVPLIAILSPVVTYVIDMLVTKYFNGFQLGFLILLVNGMLMVIGLWAIRRKQKFDHSELELI